jgi:hypothetical protein
VLAVIVYVFELVALIALDTLAHINTILSEVIVLSPCVRLLANLAHFVFIDPMRDM